MTTAPEKVYLHIGLHKTGTTFLQNIFRANQAALRSQGVEFPGGPGEPRQGLAVWDLQRNVLRSQQDSRILGSWDALTTKVNSSDYATTLISMEWLSLCTPRQVKRVVAAFPDSEVHVIVTARDLARVVPSDWQEEIKNGRTWTWSGFVEAIKHPEQGSVQPARGFWSRHDLALVCRRWESEVSPERIHVVTVPPSGAPPETLLNRFASLVGFDPARLTEAPEYSNETLGVAATEVVRRVNQRLDGLLNNRQYDRAMKLTTVPVLGQRTGRVKFALPEPEFAWVSARAEQMITDTASRGYQVVGDLDELRPQRTTGGRAPDDVTESELLEAALDGFAVLAERFAKSWWQRKKPDLVSHEATQGNTQKLGTALAHGRLRMSRLARRSKTTERAAGSLLKARDRLRDRIGGKRR